jgi:hypothetical protein
MAIYIIKLAGLYLEWSTNTDAPVCNGMDLAEFKEYCQDKYSNLEDSADMSHLEYRLANVERKGTSSELSSLDSLISHNRAGDEQKHLDIDKLIEKYCPKANSSGLLSVEELAKRPIYWST